jgi:hypothetical protein
VTTREQAAIICAVLASGTGLSEYDVAWSLGFPRQAAWLADRMTSAVIVVDRGGTVHATDATAADLLWDGFDPCDVVRLRRLT